MIHYTMNIRQTMLHLSGGLLLLLAPACTSEVDLEGGQPLEVTAEIVSSLSTRLFHSRPHIRQLSPLFCKTRNHIRISGKVINWRRKAALTLP